MFDIFSSREIALGIWAFVLIIALFVNKKIRSSFYGMIKIALSRHLSIPFLCILIYTGVFTFILTRFSIWEWIYLKDIIIWVLFAGVPTCFKAISKSVIEKFYVKIVLDNIILSAFVEFILSTFTFHLAIELLLIPILVFLFLAQAMAETRNELKPLHKPVSFVIIIVVILIFLFTAIIALNEYRSIGITTSIVEFCIPVMFSLMILPVAYLFSIIARYQSVFGRMSFRIPDDNQIQKIYKYKVFRTCGLSHNRILQFENEYVGIFYKNMGKEKFYETFQEFREKRSDKK